MISAYNDKVSTEEKKRGVKLWAEYYYNFMKMQWILFCKYRIKLVNAHMSTVLNNLGPWNVLTQLLDRFSAIFNNIFYTNYHLLESLQGHRQERQLRIDHTTYEWLILGPNFSRLRLGVVSLRIEEMFPKRQLKGAPSLFRWWGLQQSGDKSDRIPPWISLRDKVRCCHGAIAWRRTTLLRK